MRCGPVMAQTLSTCSKGRELRNTLSVTSPMRCSSSDMGNESSFFQPLLGHQMRVPALPLRVTWLLYS